MSSLEELKKKREQLTARILQAEARQTLENRKLETKVKLLVGAAVLHNIKQKGGLEKSNVLEIMKRFLVRPADVKAVLGEGSGSEMLIKLTSPEGQKSKAAPLSDFV